MFRKTQTVLNITIMTAFYVALSALIVVGILERLYIAAAVVALFALVHFLLYRRNSRFDQVSGAANIPAAETASGMRSFTLEVHNSEGELVESCLQSDSASLKAVSQPQSWWHVYGDGCTSSSVLSGSSHRDADLGIGGGDIDANPDQRFV